MNRHVQWDWRCWLFGLTWRGREGIRSAFLAVYLGPLYFVWEWYDG